MAPTRVGIIGLKAIKADSYGPGLWGVMHLKALVASPHYEVVAVCNTSVESAQKACEAHGLSAKAYGDPEDIAADPSVDLVLVSVDVTMHYALMEPAIRHGKDVFVEFPVAPSPTEVEELSKLAREKGVRVIVGTQARADPSFQKLSELVKTGVIGDVVSSVMVGNIPIVTADGWPAVQKPFLDIDSGISRARGVLGHTLDLYTHTVGGFKGIQSVLKVQHKTAVLVDSDANVVDPCYPTTAPDTMFIQGVLENGAAAFLSLRSVRKTVADVGFRWLISGTDGEIEYTSGPGVVQWLPNPEIRVRKWGGATETISVDSTEQEHVASLGPPSNNIARVWEAFAVGDSEPVATLEQSLVVHQVLEKIIREAIYAP